MDYNHPDIQIYLQNLPPVVQKCIGSAEWKVKIMEIGKKYSLQPAQINNLEMETLLVSIGVESDQEMMENVKKELDISDILAEQLVEDVNQRIYKWIYKQWSPEETKTEDGIAEQNTIKPESNSIHPLDIPPPNLPGEVIEESSNSWIPKTVPAAPEKTHSILQDQVNNFFAPAATVVEPKVEMRSEPTVIPQSPFITPAVQNPSKPQSFISQKLSQPTAPQKYTADPYREPIE